jgi:RHS repeat-associated protein
MLERVSAAGAAPTGAWRSDSSLTGRTAAVSSRGIRASHLCRSWQVRSGGLVRKTLVRALTLVTLMCLAIPVWATTPWDWTVSVIPNQVFNSQQAAESALRALGGQYALAAVVEQSTITPAGTTYQYGAKSRGPDIGPWGSYTIQGQPPSPPSYSSEADAIAAVIANRTIPGCPAPSLTPAEDWRSWMPAYSGDDYQQIRNYTIHPFYSDCSPSGAGTLQGWRTRTVQCPQYMAWGGATEHYCVLHNIASIHGVPLLCNCGGPGTGNADPGGYVGNPSSTSTGDKLLQESDFKLPWIEFTRTYHSLLRTPYGSLGPGWTHSLNVRLSPNGSGPAGIITAQGDQLPLQGVGTYYEPTDGSGQRLAQGSPGWVYWNERSGQVRAFNWGGQLVRDDQVDGQHLAYSYDTDGRLTSVTNSSGRSLTLAYEAGPMTAAASHLQTITYAGVTLVTYSYDANGNLSTATRADGTVRTYLYENSAFPNHLTGILDENGVRYATYSYDAQGRAQLSTHAGGADQTTLSFNADGSTSVVTPLGATETYQFTSDGLYRKPTSIARSDGTRSWTYSGAASDFRRRPQQTIDTRGIITQYSYPDTGSVRTEQRIDAFGTSNQRTVEADYADATSLMLERRTRNASGALLTRATFVYNSRNQLTARCQIDPQNSGAMAYSCGSQSTAPMGARQSRTAYCEQADVNNGAATNCALVGQIKSAVGSRTDVADLTIYNYYIATDTSGCSTGGNCHQLGDLWQLQNALGQVTVFNRYDLFGHPVSVTDPNGTVTTLVYDLVGRLTSRQAANETTAFDYWPTGLLKKITLPDASYLLYTYDDAHRLTQISDGLGNAIDYTLDAMGNRTAENVYDPSNTLHRTHSRVFNTLSQLYQDVNAAGTAAVTTTFGNDPNSNQTSIAAPLSRNTVNAYDELNRLKQITDPANGITQFAHDANDNLTSVTDPRNLTTSYAYNGFGDLSAQTSPDTGTTANTYDSAGNLATSTDARGAVSTYAYDALNRVMSIAYSQGGVTDQTISFTYDAGTNGRGHLTGASDANHSIGWTYDTQGRVASRSQTVGSVSLAVGYGYSSGNLTSLTSPSGQAVTYGYNANHQITSVAVNGTTIVNSVTYEPLGPVNGWMWGNGTTTSRTYDTDGKLTHIASAGTKIYNYDDAFRITGISDTSPGSANWIYGYDALDRITSGASPSVTRGWTYDANGNRLTETGTAASTYSISPTNNRISSVSGTLARTYGYDAAGNSTSYASVTATYNNAGRLKTLTQGGSTETAIYNALGQRVQKSGGTAGTVLFWYDEAGHLLGEYDGTGALIEETVWLGDIPVATLRPNGSTVSIYYVHTDQLNTPRQVTRPSDNAQVWTWFSDPFGTDAANANPSGAGTFAYNLRFAGQIFDGQAGLHQNYMRDYDPAVGRYVESDPIGLKGGIDPYVYALSEPTVFSDPSGLSTSLTVRCGPVMSGQVHCAVVARCSKTGEATRFELGGPVGATNWQKSWSGLIPPKSSTPNPPGTPASNETDYSATCSGDDCDCKAFKCLKKAFGDSQPPRYYALWQNSNTFAHSLLSQCNCGVDPYVFMSTLKDGPIYSTTPGSALGW